MTTRMPQPNTSGELSLATQVGLISGPFLSLIDTDIMTVALPNIATQLHTTLETAQWILTAYLLALAACLAASAFLAKRFGTRKVYLISLAGFTVASVLCAFTPTISFLIAARALQGMLGAPLLPLAMNMMLRGSGAQRRRLPPTVGMALYLAPAIGPTLGGFLLHISGWSTIFLINVPIGILGILAVLGTFRQADTKRSSAPFDPLGIVLLAGGLVLTIYGATQGPQEGWLANDVWPLLISGLLMLLVYVFWALHRSHPAVDLKLLHSPQSGLAIGLSVLTAVVIFSMLFLIPVYLEEVQRVSPLIAGLVLLPQALMTGLGTIIGHRLSTRLSALLGMVIITTSTALLLLVNINTPAWVTALILCGRGFAVGMVLQPLLHAAIDRLAPAEIPDGNTLFNIAQRLGASIGIALVATFFTVREHFRVQEVLRASGFSLNASTSTLPPPILTKLAQAAVDGFHDTIWLLIVLSVFGMLLALLLRDAPRLSADRATSVKGAPVPADAAS